VPLQFDSGEFRKQLDKAVYDQARQAVEQKGEDLQALFDEVWASHRGRPMEEVAAELRRRAEGRADFSEVQIDGYARAISEGRRVVVQVDTSNFPA
jgi:hypothetical protein